MIRMRFKIRRQNDRSGVILPIVLTIMVILTVVAAGLSRTARANLALARRSMGAVNSKFLAWAGIVYAIDEIRRDSNDETGRTFDRIGLCGIVPDDTMKPEDRFSRQDFKSGYFEIGYDDGTTRITGFSDEESKINLNGLNRDNINVFIQLLQMSGADENKAQVAAYSVLDWKDADDELSHQDYGAEDDYYMNMPRPYHVKNYFFESVEELLLVRDMDPLWLDGMRPYLTIHPQDDFLRMNLDTASLTALKALGRAFTGGQTNTDPEDADSLAQKIVDYRSGEDRRPATDDDRPVDFQEISLNQKEQVIAEKLRMTQTSVSDYLRVRVRAVESRRQMATAVEAVIDRNSLAIVQWSRE